MIEQLESALWADVQAGAFTPQSAVVVLRHIDANPGRSVGGVIPALWGTIIVPGPWNGLAMRAPVLSRANAIAFVAAAVMAAIPAAHDFIRAVEFNARQSGDGALAEYASAAFRAAELAAEQLGEV